MARGRGRRTLIVGIMLAVFTVAFQSIGLATALPTLMASFNASHLYPWAFTTMVTGMLVSTIVTGRIADLKGPAGPLLAGFVLFAVGLLLGWGAPSVWMVLAARLVQGLGAGALNLTLSVVVAHAFSPQERPRMMALVSFCWLLPAFVGPPFAAWLTHYSWRLVFASMLPLVVLAFVITLPGLREVQRRFVADPEVSSVAPLPIVAVAVAPSLILIAGQTPGLLRFATAAAGAIALIWGLGRVLAPSARGVGPGVPSVVLARATQAGAFFAAETILLVTLQDLKGFSPFQVGWALTVGSIGWTAGSWLQAQRWCALSRDQFVTLGAVLTSVGIGALAAYAWVEELSLLFGLIAWVVAGLGMGLTMPSSAVAVMSLSSQFEQGRNQSSMQVAEAVGNSVMTAIAGGVYTALLVSPPQPLSYTAGIGVTAVISLIAIVVSTRIGRIENESAAR